MKQNFAVLSTRLLDRLLSTPPTKVRYKSGTTPAAQIENQLQNNGQDDKLKIVSDSIMEQIKRENQRLYHLINFMSASACRVSEALNIRPYDITANGFVKLNTLKRGKPRIVHAGMSTEYMIHCKLKGLIPFDGMNRFFVYRCFKRYGIETQLKGRKKKTVTHLPRHFVAQQIQKAGMDIKLSQQALGQNSLKSTSFYHESEPKKQ